MARVLSVTCPLLQTTAAHPRYLDPALGAFDGFVDYAQLVKRYGADPAAGHGWSAAKCIGCEKSWEIG